MAEIRPTELDADHTDERTQTMNITVNRKPHSFDSKEMTLAALLEACQVPEKGIAVALNNRVVRKADWPKTMVNDGDAVTVIQAVCGG